MGTGSLCRWSIEFDGRSAALIAGAHLANAHWHGVNTAENSVKIETGLPAFDTAVFTDQKDPKYAL